MYEIKLSDHQKKNLFKKSREEKNEFSEERQRKNKSQEDFQQRWGQHSAEKVSTDKKTHPDFVSKFPARQNHDSLIDKLERLHQ